MLIYILLVTFSDKVTVIDITDARTGETLETVKHITDTRTRKSRKQLIVLTFVLFFEIKSYLIFVYCFGIHLDVSFSRFNSFTFFMFGISTANF